MLVPAELVTEVTTLFTTVTWKISSSKALEFPATALKSHFPFSSTVW